MKKRKKTKKRVIVCSILIGLLLVQFTQDEGDFKLALSEKMETYKANYPMEMVYIHTDRDVYSPGDELSFKAYIRDLYSFKPSEQSEMLNLALMDYQGKIVLNSPFQIEGSQAAGKLRFTNSIPEGKYFLIGFTDLMRGWKPEYAFKKELFITTISFPGTIIHLSTPDTMYNPGDEAEIEVTLISPEGKTIRNSFAYDVRTNGSSFFSGEGKTDRTGKCIIPVKLPEFENPALITLELTVERSRTVEKVSIIIPTTGLPYSVDLFPEGGNLIDGVETKVGFIARDYFGNPAEIEGQILDPDNRVLTRFRSQFDGLGYFSYVPDRNKPARIKLTRPMGVDELVNFPDVSSKGAILSFEGRSGDLLSFNVVNTLDEKNGLFHIVAEQHGEIIWYQSHPVERTIPLSIPVSDLPEGVIHVTLFNSLGDALSHRAVYHGKSRSSMQLKTNQNEYMPKEEVVLNIEMQNPEGDMIAADLSVSATDANLSPDWNQDPDIYSCFLLGPAIGKSPFPPGYFYNKASEIENNIDILMLTVRDDKFNWGTLMGKEAGPPESITGQNILGEIRSSCRLDHIGMLQAQIQNAQFFNRYILKYNLIFPEYYLVNKRYFAEKETDGTRRFSENWIQGDLANGIPILDVIRKIKNFQLMDNKIVFYGPNSILNQEGALLVFNGIKMGTDVRILSSLNPHDIANIRVITNPTEVLMYTGFNPVGIIEITTKGGAGPEEKATDTAQVYNPTLYWNPFIYTLEGRRTSLSFKSSFMQSSYTIVVQGVDENGNPVYGTRDFSVF